MNVSNENTTTPTENLKQINGTQDLENSELTKKINNIVALIARRVSVVLRTCN